MATTETLLMGSFNDWEDMYSYVSLYGVHIVIGALLSAVTIYRREMSCNRVFHEDDSDDEAEDESLSAPFCISDELEAEAEELLDGAGMYCSGQPIVALAAAWLEFFTSVENGDNSKDDLLSWDMLDHAGNISTQPIIAAIALALLNKDKLPKDPIGGKLKEKKKFEFEFDPFTNQLPPDSHVHIASFLHPKDVTSLACVSKSYREVVDRGDTSNAIWKTLWERDYAWIVQNWIVGQIALKRSNPPSSFVVDKEFYFAFGKCYINYVLAGQNTQESCLVGLHSHIYDITNFLDDHPGSPDTLMVHAGSDCTTFFEDMGHSMIARRLAKNLCVVADMSHFEGGCGVRPTAHTVVNVDNDHHLPRRELEAGENLLRGRKQRPRSGTLQTIRDRLNKEEEQVRYRVLRGEVCCPDALATVTPFYDPFIQAWRVWYISHDLESVILPA
jgi:hypothetical protein